MSNNLNLEDSPRHFSLIHSGPQGKNHIRVSQRPKGSGDKCFLNSFYHFIYLFGWTTMCKGSQFPHQRVNPCTLQQTYGVLTTGPPGKSLSKCLLNVNYLWKVCWGLWRIRRKKMNKLCLTPCSLLSYASFNPRKWCLLLFLKREKWGSAVLQNCLRTQSYLVVGMEFKSRTNFKILLLPTKCLYMTLKYLS